MALPWVETGLDGSRKREIGFIYALAGLCTPYERGEKPYLHLSPVAGNALASALLKSASKWFRNVSIR